MNISFLTVLIVLPCLAGMIRVVIYLKGTLKMLRNHILQRLERENKLTFFVFLLQQLTLLAIFLLILINNNPFIEFLHDSPFIGAATLICIWYWGVVKWKDLTIGTDNTEI